MFNFKISYNFNYNFNYNFCKPRVAYDELVINPRPRYTFIFYFSSSLIEQN